MPGSLNIGYIPALHHLRCLAATLVFVTHYLHYYLYRWTPQPKMFMFGLFVEGHTGVGLFFSLSGFLFTTIAFSGTSNIQYGQFLKNRLLRIFPLYIFVFFIALAIGNDSIHGTNILDFLLPNAGSPISMSLITGAAWTIPVEFSFYLVFPFLVRFYRTDGSIYLFRLIALLLAAKAGVFLAVARPDLTIYATVVGRMDQFLIGMLAAGWSLRRREGLKRYGPWLLAASTAATILALAALARYASLYGPPRNWLWLFWPTIEAVLWSAVIVGYVAVQPRWPRWLDAALQRGGEISYSLYMLHCLAIYGLYQTVGRIAFTGRLRLDMALNAIPVVLLTLWLAGTSYAVIERPFLRLRGRYIG